MKSANHVTEPNSVEVTTELGGPNPGLVPFVLEGDKSQPSRIVIIRGPAVASQAHIEIAFSVRTWNTQIDEQIARAREWPEAAWPSDIMPFLQPDDQAPSDLLPIRTFTKALTGNDPRSRPPYDLAKKLAASAIDHCRHAPSKAADPSDSVESALFRIVMDRAASDEELPVFLCAIYRAAGLPARLLHGIDLSGEGGPCRRSWVEFLLPGADGAPGEWIPVDIVRQRRISPRAPSSIPSWEWFGNNEGLNQVIPFEASPAATPHDRRLQNVALFSDYPACSESAAHSASDKPSSEQIPPSAPKPAHQ